MKTKYVFPLLLALASCSKKGDLTNPVNINPDNGNGNSNNNDSVDAGYSYKNWANTTLDTTVDPTKPNIIFIICDQMFVDKINAMGKSGAMGGSYNKTPNLDYMIRNGYYFCNAFCAFPLSVPSRFSLFTGCNAAEYSMNGNDVTSQVHIDQVQDVISKGPLLGTLFQKAGYNTVYGGKTHLPGVGGNKAQANLYGFTDYYSSDQRSQLGLDAAKAIGSYARKDKPFFLVASFINPHDIDFYDSLIGYPVTDEDAEGSAADVIQPFWGTSNTYIAAGTWPAVFPPIIPNLARTDPSPVGTLAYHNNMPGVHPGFLRPDTTIRLWRQRSWLYDRLCEALDSNLTPIMDTIRNLQLLNNTILIFTADHGELNGAHELERKQSPYNECQKVPFIFLGKGIKQKKDDSNWVINGYDLQPTLCDIVGIVAPERGAGGISLKSVLTGASAVPEKPRDYFFTDGPGWHQIVYQKQYKYTLIFIPNTGGVWWETLIDLSSDPLELNNLKGDPNYQGIKMTLRNLLVPDMQRRPLITNLAKLNNIQ